MSTSITREKCTCQNLLPLVFTLRMKSVPYNASGDVGQSGKTGTSGPPGPKGQKGQEGQGLSGVKYVRWGRTNCSGDAQVVYSGN